MGGLAPAFGVSPTGDKIVGWYVREIKVLQVSGCVRRNEDGEIEFMEDEDGEVIECFWVREIADQHGEIILIDTNEQGWPASQIALARRGDRGKDRC